MVHFPWAALLLHQCPRLFTTSSATVHHAVVTGKQGNCGGEGCPYGDLDNGNTMCMPLKQIAFMHLAHTAVYTVRSHCGRFHIFSSNRVLSV